MRERMDGWIERIGDLATERDEVKLYAWKRLHVHAYWRFSALINLELGSAIGSLLLLPMGESEKK